MSLGRGQKRNWGRRNWKRGSGKEEEIVIAMLIFTHLKEKLKYEEKFHLAHPIMHTGTLFSSFKIIQWFDWLLNGSSTHPPIKERQGK